MSLRLADGQFDAYRRDGFVRVPGLFSEAEAERFRGWAAELADAPPVPGGAAKYGDDEAAREGRRLLSRVEYLRNFHAGFREVMESERILTQVGRLLGEPARLFKDKLNYKPPGGSAFQAHQDAQAGWGSYCATHLSVLVSLDETTLENGCLELAPGQHRRGMIGRLWHPLEGSELHGLQFVPCPTRPGDAVFFDSYVPHRSAPNRTLFARRVLYLTYNPASQGDHYETYFAEKRKCYPPDNERAPGREYRYRV